MTGLHESVHIESIKFLMWFGKNHLCIFRSSMWYPRGSIRPYWAYGSLWVSFGWAGLRGGGTKARRGSGNRFEPIDRLEVYWFKQIVLILIDIKL